MFRIYRYGFFSSFDYTLLTFASSMLNEIKRNIMSIVAVE